MAVDSSRYNSTTFLDDIPRRHSSTDIAAIRVLRSVFSDPLSPAQHGHRAPPLSFVAVTSDDEKRDALRLVADSIAQQRQVAALAVIFHPVCAAVCRRHADLAAALTAVAGLVIAYLAAVRLLTSRYLALAEQFRWRDFLAADSDVVVAARFGRETIGCLVLRLLPPADGEPAGRGLVRAWTTSLRYRGRGVGADLLRFAVVATRSACGDAAPVSFAPDHANSALPLSSMFNRPFTRRDEKAAKALEHALSDCDRGQSGFQQSAPRTR